MICFGNRRETVYGNGFERVTGLQPKMEKDKQQNPSKWDQHPASIAMHMAEAHRSVNADEVPFNVEAEDIPKPSLPWSSLHLPRMPRYFNRARTSYEWNKYNQTHYDADNPPPKTLAGLSLQHLLSPTWLIPIDYPPMLLRRIQMGMARQSSFGSEPVPPYMDLVFRIPGTEWESAAKHGFKCTFDRRALRLHFWFKKARFLSTK